MIRDVLFEYHRAVFLFAEQLDQLEVCLPYSRIHTGGGIQIKHLYVVLG